MSLSHDHNVGTNDDNLDMSHDSRKVSYVIVLCEYRLRNDKYENNGLRNKDSHSFIKYFTCTTYTFIGA